MTGCSCMSSISRTCTPYTGTGEAGRQEVVHQTWGGGYRAPWAAGKSLKKETKLGLSVRKAEDFATWYPEAIVAGEFISYYDVSGVLLSNPKP